MTTMTKRKPKAAAVPGKRKPKGKWKADADDVRPPLFERLMESFDLLERHLKGEDVGVKVTVYPRTTTRWIAELKAAREAAGLTLAQVAARSGLRVETLSRLELGKVPNPTVNTLARYAAGVGRRLTLGSVPAG